MYHRILWEGSCEMAQCQADLKKHGSTRFDLYGGIFSPQLYGATIGGNGHVERMQSCPSFHSAGDYNNVINNRVSGGENFVQENVAGAGFRQENGVKAAAGGGLKSESPKGGYGTGDRYGVKNSGAPAFGKEHRRRSTGGMMGPTPVLTTPEASPVQASKGAAGAQNRNKLNTKEQSPSSGTPPFPYHSPKSSGELSSSERILVKGIHPDAFGEIIKGVGNLCDDLDRHSSGLKSGDLDSGSGSSKGRSPRAESPKSIGSSSSGGSSSGGSPTVGRIVNFGNILPSGGPVVKPGSSPSSNPAAAPSVSGRGAHSNGHAPVPVPTSGSLKGSRRSNSWDYATGSQKAAHARSGSESGTGGGYAGNVGISPRGSLSTSPSSSAYSSPQCADSSLHSKAGAVSENLAIRNALASMDPETVKNVGNDQYKKGYFTEALNLYDKAICLAPDKAPYRSNRAAALTGLGRLPEAVQECLHAIRLDPAYTRAHHRLGSLYLRYENPSCCLMCSPWVPFLSFPSFPFLSFPSLAELCAETCTEFK